MFMNARLNGDSNKIVRFVILDVYCPQGSSSPITVSAGYYSIGRGDNFIRNTIDSSDRSGRDDVESLNTRIGQNICEE